ncbi:hypothetical protein OH76DRAFT_1410874 [Lentinus brumalis]|uniref:BTB domain-containing protein n=1 Tax=Lentinus brumalis TaxID=2498619 RepID=A0A371CQZ6_9APHY|nr:hypothetical protein OH76DRAFT_1410874 [Polyporus brumalis]
MTQSTMTTRSPFDDTDGDIVIRSSDEVEFRLYKNIIAKASPVFQGMLTLPSGADAPEEPQTVPLTEDADTLEALFRLCYPVERPRFTDFNRLRAVLEAARKYEMGFVSTSLKDSLLQFIETDPLRVYATGYILQFGDVARAAARRLLEIPDFADPVPPPPEFTEIPAMALHYVFEYRRKCAIAARSVLDNMDWMSDGDPGRRISIKKGNMTDTSGSWVWLSCPNKGYAIKDVIYLRIPLDDSVGRRPFYAAPWWTKYIERIKGETGSRPFVKAVTDSITLEPFINEAMKCTTCAPKAWKDLTDFSQLLAEKIQEAVSKVELPF